MWHWQFRLDRIVLCSGNLSLHRKYLELPEDGHDIWQKRIGDVYNNKYRNILHLVGGKICIQLCITQK